MNGRQTTDDRRQKTEKQQLFVINYWLLVWADAPLGAEDRVWKWEVGLRGAQARQRRKSEKRREHGAWREL